MVTIKIGDYDVKRVLVDQGSGAKNMYPDLERYDSLLMGFDGRMVSSRNDKVIRTSWG